MSRAQEFKRCPVHGVVQVRHKCESEQRPQAKMRGPTAGLTTGPAWDSARWAEHLRGKAEPGAKPDTTASVRVGDVWKSQFEYRVTQVSPDGKLVYYTGPSGAQYSDTIEAFVKDRWLVTRAQKAERSEGVFMVGDVVEDSQFAGECMTVVSIGGRPGSGADDDSVVWCIDKTARNPNQPDGAFYWYPEGLKLVRAVGVE